MLAPPASPPCYFLHFSPKHMFFILVYEGKGADMKGYVTAAGYMGFVDGRFMLFDSEGEYTEYMRETVQGE